MKKELEKIGNGRAIKTTGNHPYLTIINNKEQCNEYLNNGFNNNIPESYTQQNYCLRWVEVKYLKENSYVAVPNNLLNSRSMTCSVLNTLTLDCFFNLSSSDQIPQSEASARAKYLTSSGSGEICSASSANILKSENGIKSVSSFRNLNTLASSSADNLLFSTISSKCLPISVNRNSGAINSNLATNLLTKKTSKTLPFDIRAEKNLFASITNSVDNQLFSDCLNLCDRDLSTLLDNSKTSFLVNLLLDTILFNSSNLANSCFRNLLIATDHSIAGSSFMSCSNSSGISTLNLAISTSQSKDSKNQYINLSMHRCIMISKKEVLKNQKEVKK